MVDSSSNAIAPCFPYPDEEEDEEEEEEEEEEEDCAFSDRVRRLNIGGTADEDNDEKELRFGAGPAKRSSIF